MPHACFDAALTSAQPRCLSPIARAESQRSFCGAGATESELIWPQLLLCWVQRIWAAAEMGQSAAAWSPQPAQARTAGAEVEIAESAVELALLEGQLPEEGTSKHGHVIAAQESDKEDQGRLNASLAGNSLRAVFRQQTWKELGSPSGANVVFDQPFVMVDPRASLKRLECLIGPLILTALASALAAR